MGRKDPEKKIHPFLKGKSSCKPKPRSEGVTDGLVRHANGWVGAWQRLFNCFLAVCIDEIFGLSLYILEKCVRST